MPLRILIVAIGMLVAGSFRFHSAQAADIRDIFFPILGGGSYRSDFGDPRSGHTHQGNDIFNAKHTPLLATVDGRVRFLGWPQPSYGYIVSIEDDDGYEYWYLHINNDHPGTDDGLGGGNYAYAPNVEDNQRVVAGQVIGYLGDSGNAESTTPHLHFEIHRPDGNTIDPFPTLRAASILTRAVPTPLVDNEWLPFASFRGGAYLAIGDTHPASAGNEIVTGAGPGGGPLVRIFDEVHNPLGGFYAYDQRYFRNGIDVAIGDINADGQNEIITGTAFGAEPFVRAFTKEGGLLAEFLAYPKKFLGGVNVSAADLDGDGITEIITGPGKGMTPTVRMYHANGDLLAEWDAYTPLFKGGIDVAGVPMLGGDPGYVVTSPLRGGGPDIRTWRFDGSLIGAFFGYEREYRGGVRVAGTRDLAGALKIVTAPLSGGSNLRTYRMWGELLDGRFMFEEWWSGGYDVAADSTTTLIVNTKSVRPTSLRFLDTTDTPETDQEPPGGFFGD